MRPSGFACALRVAALVTLARVASSASSTCYDAVSVGGFHGLVLASNTSVAFGENSAGQADVPAALASLTVGVAAGGFHSCALHYVAAGSAATSVTCWGGAGSGATSVPAAVTTDGGITALAAGGYHTCAITSDGSLVCWGASGAGQTTTPLELVSTGAITVAAGTYHSCAVATVFGSYRVACWGRDAEGQVSGLPAALAAGSGGPGLRLSCGGYHCCAWGGALSTPACWGASSSGQTSLPASVPGSSWASLCAGGRFTCGLTTSGNVSCWGSGAKGETAVPPAAAANGSAVGLACGWYSACALLKSGSFVCWGGSAGRQAASVAGVDVVMTTASTLGVGSGSLVSGSILMSSGGAGAGGSGAVSITTGAAAGGGASGAIVLQTGAASGGGSRGAISLLAPVSMVGEQLLVGGGISIGGRLQIGNTSLTEADLQTLLATLLASATASPTPSASVSPSTTPSLSVTATLTASRTQTPSRTPSASPPPPYTVLTVAGAAGQTGAVDSLTDPTAVRFFKPHGVVYEPSTPPGLGSLVVADHINGLLRRVFFNGSAVTLAAGLSLPNQLFRDPSSGLIYIADQNAQVVRTYNPSTGVLAVLAGTLGVSGTADSASGTAVQFSDPTGVCRAADGFMYVADCLSHTIRRVDPATGATTTVAGVAGSPGTANGVGTAARFSYPHQMLCLPDGTVLVAESGNCAIRRLNTTTSEVTTFAGVVGSCGHQDGPAATAQFRGTLAGLALDADGSLLVVDRSNHVIRRVAGGVVTTVAGGVAAPGSTNALGTAARFDEPHGVVIIGRTAFITDINNHLVRAMALPA